MATNSNGSGTLAVTTPTAVVTSEAAALSSAMVPSNQTATVKQLLRRGGQSATFHAPTAGHLEISWYINLDRDARRSRRVLIAKLSLKVPAGTTAVLLTRSPGDRHLLVHLHLHYLTIIATGRFTPVGKRAITVTRRFKLKQ